MRELPENWIDKLFDLLKQYYGDRWSKQFNSDFQIDLVKTIWKNGLGGLSYDQIRHGLAVSKKYAYSSIKPPTVVLFYHFCIGLHGSNVLRVTSSDCKLPKITTPR